MRNFTDILTGDGNSQIFTILNQYPEVRSIVAQILIVPIFEDASNPSNCRPRLLFPHEEDGVAVCGTVQSR